MKNAGYHFIVFDKETNNIIFEMDAAGGSKSDCKRLLDLELMNRHLYVKKLDGLVKIKAINKSL